MNSRLFLFVLLLIGVSIFDSCSKPGLGGQNTVNVTPQHHGRNIKDCIVYVKFGTSELPGTLPSNYDASFSTNPPDSFTVKVTGLKEGDYYFYGIGFDSTIMLPVSGGLPVTMKNS